ncbi:hypothetical protein QQP08_007442 [Theobroma cacao]|nr:hypothetical protein QQP08_007442 [Theobroma cacao]
MDNELPFCLVSVNPVNPLLLLEKARQRSRQPRADLIKDQSFRRNRQSDTLEKVNQILVKFECDRDKRIREKVLMYMYFATFAPMNGGTALNSYDTNSRNQPFDTQRYFSVHSFFSFRRTSNAKIKHSTLLYTTESPKFRGDRVRINI